MLICVWPCIMYVGKLYRSPTRCNNDNLLIFKDKLNMFRTIFCPSSGAYDCDLQLLVLRPSVVVGWVRRAATWHYVYGMKDVSWLSLWTQPTTTLGHNTRSCKSQSYAPDDGQKLTRNMLSWSLKINTLSLLHLVWLLYYFPQIMLSNVFIKSAAQ